MSASADIRQFANTLMVGHGGALLLIFNARIQNSTVVNEIPQAIAYTFAAGLVFAFWLYYLIYKSDVSAEQRGQITSAESLLEALKERRSRESFMGYLFIGSCGCFILGLMSGIHMLGLRANP